ncbi:hypothetical protein PAPYR_9568 [Paratrimastix pyriformis]|uniref:Uncharacterized protein n=1 Tax=Paratrimastix pyriformis TaxID=342808 RepID=A0ABQ8U826_9EUKA|nr:hypothetical protein PAPYR_9568 [Paratrimastix pyriformis]
MTPWRNGSAIDSRSIVISAGGPPQYSSLPPPPARTQGFGLLPPLGPQERPVVVPHPALYARGGPGILPGLQFEEEARGWAPRRSRFSSGITLDGLEQKLAAPA